jgi:hypothetical protein
VCISRLVPTSNVGTIRDHTHTFHAPSRRRHAQHVAVALSTGRLFLLLVICGHDVELLASRCSRHCVLIVMVIGSIFQLFLITSPSSMIAVSWSREGAQFPGSAAG